MRSKLYKKGRRINIKKLIRFTGLGLAVSGTLLGFYVFFPIISWELYLKPVFAESSYASPIPKNTIITRNYFKNLITDTGGALSSINYNNSTNWLPQAEQGGNKNMSPVSFYSLTISSISLENAMVSTIDTDLSSHLVHFPGTSIPPEKGTAAVFGHSTLPHLYNRNDYRTIFAKIHNTKIGDLITVTVNNTLYNYRVFDIQVTDAHDSSYLTQNYDASYLYIITCTPPGTTWKRLVVKTRLEQS
jgi:sortase A